MSRHSERAKLVRELRSDVCRCGRRKGGGKTFCRRCYLQLPTTIRGKLYFRLGEGYEEAHRQAVEYLEGKGTETEAKGDE